MAPHQSLRELIADVQITFDGLHSLQMVVALKAAANALQKITRLQDKTLLAPQEIKQAKYLAQMALNQMDKAALDFGLDEGSEVKKIRDARAAAGAFQACQGCGTPAKCAGRKECNAERAERLQRAKESANG